MGIKKLRPEWPDPCNGVSGESGAILPRGIGAGRHTRSKLRAMGVLFLAKEITKPSVVWMRRMLDGLGDDVSIFASRGEVGADYRKRFETLQLANKGPKSPPWRRALERTGILRKPEVIAAARKLRKAIGRDDVDCVLVHYADEAVRIRSLWERTDKPIFVHCHGADVTWGGRNQRDGGPGSLPIDYVDQVKRLSGRARFIANSRTTASRLEGIGIIEDRIAIKYPGVEVRDECPTRPRRHSGASILYLGNLVDWKGSDLTLRAFEHACELGLRGRIVTGVSVPSNKAIEASTAKTPWSRIPRGGP